MGNNMMLIWILLLLEEYLSIINGLISISFVLISGALYHGKTDKEYMDRFDLQSLTFQSLKCLDANSSFVETVFFISDY